MTLDESIAQLSEKLDDIVSDQATPNAAFGIVRGDQLIWFQGFGHRDVKGELPVNAQTAFRIGSITKTLTGVALLQLRDAGKLSLDDPLSKYVPEATGVTVPGGARTPILLRHLLTHTSGLPREVFSGGSVEGGPTEAYLVQALRGLVLDFEPGTDESYSNYGMALAGLVIARASGEPYREYMQRHVFAPLQMTHTAFDPAELPAGTVAVGYQRAGDKAPYTPIARQLEMGAMEPCGGLYSTIEDLTRFASFELAAWSGRDDGILSRASRLESQAPEPFALRAGNFTGVTWQLGDAKIGRQVWHDGSISGYRAILALYPNRGLALIALTGSDQEPTLWKLQNAAVDALEAIVPAPGVQLGLQAQTALDRVLSFVNAPARKRISALFSAGFRESFSDGMIETFAEGVHASAGSCDWPPVAVRGGASRATVWLSCEKKNAVLELGIIPATGLIDYWSVKEFNR